MVDASSGVLGKEDWALAVGGGRVRGTGSSCSVVCGGKDRRKRWKSRRKSETAGTLSQALPIAVQTSNAARPSAR